MTCLSTSAQKIDLSENSVDMSELWKRAQRINNGGHDPKTEKIVTKIV